MIKNNGILNNGKRNMKLRHVLLIGSIFLLHPTNELEASSSLQQHDVNAG
jgi:hypothetical protein